MKKSFRGRLADDAIEQIRLKTNNGLTGYKIVKLQIIPENPGTADYESLVKIFTTNTNETGSARTATENVDFTDPTLLATAFQSGNANAPVYPTSEVIIFDNMTINQDIFITHTDIRHGSGNGSNCNYYLELEQVKLSHDEAAVATLKDMRAGPDTRFGP